jgi:hypothetical protein
MDQFPIDKIEVWVQKIIPIVYDDTLSLYEVTQKVIEKLNETIGAVNEYFGQDISYWIEQILIKWKDEGTLDTIINQTIFNDLNTKIDTAQTDIAAIQTDQTEQNANIAANTASIGVNASNITGLRTDVNSLLAQGFHFVPVDNTGDATTVTTKLQTALNNIKENEIICLSGTYLLNATITGTSARIWSDNATLKFSNAGNGLHFKGTLKRDDLTASGGYARGTNSLVLNSTSTLSKGDLIRFVATGELYHPSRSYFYKGLNSIIERISGTTVYFNQAAPYDMTNINHVQVYTPAEVHLFGKLRIENTGALPNGLAGLTIERAANCHIQHVVVDNFESNITTINSVNVTYEYCRTERAWYTGSGLSYGFVTNSSNHVFYNHCSTRSGRHGHASGGFEPNDHIMMKNCSFFNEPAANEASFDLHDNMINITLENCEMDAFNINGKVSMLNCTVHHKHRTISKFGSSDSFTKTNYLFENLNLPNGGNMSLSGYAQSGGTWTMDKIGAIKIVNVNSPSSCSLTLKGRDTSGMPIQNINFVSIENTSQMQVLMSDVVNHLHVRNYMYLNDAVNIYQYSGGGLIRSALFENVQIGARYTGLQLVNFWRATFINCTDTAIAAASPRAIIDSSASGHATFINCDFTNHTEGFDLNVNTYTLIDTKMTMYGTPNGIAKTL